MILDIPESSVLKVYLITTSSKTLKFGLGFDRPIDEYLYYIMTFQRSETQLNHVF